MKSARERAEHIHRARNLECHKMRTTMTNDRSKEAASMETTALHRRHVSRFPRIQHHFMHAVPVFTVFSYAVLLLSYHVTADGNSSYLPHNDSSSFEAGVQSLLHRFSQGPDHLTILDKILFGVFIMLALELLCYLTQNSGRWLNQKLIPVRGKHLDELSQKDIMFIGMNKAATSPFVYILFRYAYFEPDIVWDFESLSWSTVLLPLPVVFVVYDFFYTILHWALHIKAIYGYIHKHHHHQKAPSRGNVDAVNVHPIEFFLGEYNHLFSLWLCCKVMKIHVVCVVLFLAVGGALAGINHTRYDTVFSVFSFKFYDSKAHDVHHRQPQSNYGQYIMLWDYVFGSYRPYDVKDRVNPKAQLDPRTGKSIEYMEMKGLKAKAS